MPLVQLLASNQTWCGRCWKSLEFSLDHRTLKAKETFYFLENMATQCHIMSTTCLISFKIVYAWLWFRSILSKMFRELKWAQFTEFFRQGKLSCNLINSRPVNTSLNVLMPFFLKYYPSMKGFDKLRDPKITFHPVYIFFMRRYLPKVVALRERCRWDGLPCRHRNEPFQPPRQFQARLQGNGIGDYTLLPSFYSWIHIVFFSWYLNI